VHVFNTWKDPTTGQKVDMDQAYSPLGGLSASYGGKLAMLGNRGWGAGISFQPFGGAIVSWPDGWPGRYRILEVDRKVFSGVATVGLEVIPQVRIGGGFVYYYTWQKFTRNIFQGNPPFPTPPGTPDALATLDMSGGAPSFDVSAEFEPIPSFPLTIAADYKHKASQDLDGDVKWSGLVLPPLISPIFANQDVKETLTIPNTLNIGAAYRAIKPLLVTFTFTLDRWVVYDQDRFVGSNPGAVLTVGRHYRNGQTYRGGVEYDLTPAWQVRAGLQRDVSGLRTDFYAPDLPDASSWGGSLGATYNFGRGFNANAAVFYAKMDKVTATNSSATEPVLAPGDVRTFRGEYTPSALVYGVSVGWTPPARHGG